MFDAMGQYVLLTTPHADPEQLEEGRRALGAARRDPRDPPDFDAVRRGEPESVAFSRAAGEAAGYQIEVKKVADLPTETREMIAEMEADERP